MKSLFHRPRLLLTLTAAFWAGNMVVGRAIAGTVPPVMLACVRWVLASLILLPFAWASLRKDSHMIWRNLPVLLFLGFMGPTCYNTLSYLGLVSTEALNGLVLNAAGPVVIAFMTWGLFGERPGAAQVAGMGAGLLGVLIVVAKGDLMSLAALRFDAGDLAIMAAVAAWSIYTAFLRKRPSIAWQSYNFVTYSVAAMVNVPAAAAERHFGYTIIGGWAAAAAIFYVSIFPSLLAYIFYNRGVELLGPAASGLYLFLIPVFGAVLAIIFLGEQLHLFHAAGFALIIGGVLAGSRGGAAARMPEPRPD